MALWSFGEVGGIRVAIAGGGTGGHTSVGLAVAHALRARFPSDLALLWVGSRAGIEARIVPEAHIPYQAISTGKLRRSWSLENITDLLLRFPAGVFQARRCLRAFRPHVLFATGGFVSVPPALAAWSLRIPVVVHEQVSAPGLANRLVGRIARRIALTFPQAASAFPRGKTVVTGNPLRPELEGGSREKAFAALRLSPDLPLVYVTGGAQGSHAINRAVGAILPELLTTAQMIHQCGEQPTTGDRAWLEAQAQTLPEPLRARYRIIPYVGAELREIYAAADLVVGRAGAGTVNECCHLGLPALFIPLPGASADEQAANARILAEAGAAVVIPEAQLSPERLRDTIRGLLQDRARLKQMGDRARSLAIPDAADRLVALLSEVAQGRRERT